ncbi:MAG: hypothetical protein ABIY51_15345 [Ferruginibacter sp.]
MQQSNIYPLVQPFPALFSDEITRNKIRKHLTDINDVITEDDIRNIRTELDGDDITPDKNSKEDGNNSSEIDTVWNIKE